MIPKILQSDNFFLKHLTVKNANKNYLSWLKDKDVNRYLECRFFKYNLNDIRNYIKKFDKKNNSIFGIFDLKNKKHIGNITLSISVHNVAYFGYLIGDKKYWGTNNKSLLSCLF